LTDVLFAHTVDIIDAVVEICSVRSLYRAGSLKTVSRELRESQRERDHKEDQDIGGLIILGWISERWDGVMWTGLVLLRIGTGGELL
jgi:hypothetical protein